MKAIRCRQSKGFGFWAWVRCLSPFMGLKLFGLVSSFGLRCRLRFRQFKVLSLGLGHLVF